MVASNFCKTRAVVDSPSILEEIGLTTDQKHQIESAMDQLVSQPSLTPAAEIVLNLLKLIHPERLPTQTQLLVNYPNPFNPETWIPFQLSQDAEVRLTIYDVWQVSRFAR